MHTDKIATLYRVHTQWGLYYRPTLQGAIDVTTQLEEPARLTSIEAIEVPVAGTASGLDDLARAGAFDGIPAVRSYSLIDDGRRRVAEEK